ncbi:MAG: hypothetical protein PHC55_13000 [Bacteroidales bacterium]|jgi:hypothetical protein|nr:hypothetical protein [Bacteroidales bacterium]
MIFFERKTKMKDFKDYLIEQLNLHPSMQPQDVVKMCYQAAFGAEHLLDDVHAAKQYFVSEYDSVPAKNIALYEEISPDFCRVNMSAWKANGLPADLLFQLFYMTASTPHGSKELLLEYLSLAEEVVSNGKTAFTADEWKAYVEKYKADGIKAVHHSQAYRKKECPSYRVISSRLLSLILILQKNNQLYFAGNI